MTRLSYHRFGSTLFLNLFLSACGGNGETQAENGPNEDNDASQDESEDLSPPRFVEPADGDIDIDANRTENLKLRVTGIRASTRLFIDGISAGRLDTPNGIGLLEQDRIHLRLFGGLSGVPHKLELVDHQAPSDEDDPAEIQLTIKPLQSFPSIKHSIERTNISDQPSVALVPIGPHQSSAIATLHAKPDNFEADNEGFVLSLVDFDGQEFANTPSHQLFVPLEHALAINELKPALAHHELSTGESTLLAAWIPNTEASAVWAQHFNFSEDSKNEAIVTKQPVNAFDQKTVSNFLGRTLEWIEFGQSTWAGAHLVVETLATTNVENPLPGERLLLTRAWDGEQFGPIRKLAEQQTNEALSIRSLINLGRIESNDSPSFSFRNGSNWRAHFLGADASEYLKLEPSFRIENIDSEETDTSLLETTIVQEAYIAGSLFDQNYFRVVTDQNMQPEIQGYRSEIRSTPSENQQLWLTPLPKTSSSTKLPESLPSGEIRAAMIQGFPALLLPYTNQELYIALSNGAQLQVRQISGLTCDSALPLASPQDNRDGQLVFACAHDESWDQVRLSLTE